MAKRFFFFDLPNERSSHSSPTISGGGIIIPVSILLWWCTHTFQHPYFIAGLMIIGAVSYIDDIKSLPVRIRGFVQIVSVLLLCYETDVFHYPWYFVVLVCLLAVAFMNAYNFMDGINGMTGLYSLLAFGTLLYINEQQLRFIDNEIIYFSGIAILVFLVFNLRRHAKWFAGDVGGFTIAFILAFLTLKLIIQSGNFFYILIFLVYATETVFTIIQRLFMHENIFLPHRKHLYQYLSNEAGFSHAGVSLAYTLFQGITNVLVLYYLHNPMVMLIIFFCIATGYVCLKSYIYRRYLFL
ncbi:MAG: UDP-GlcNAc--UDP-phosphate GlcNAc-1-phosphate transferase [Chitinophagales bacterium]|nr:UDP-GlcNAc--UDP-phosphate GlcNAc-1-phosphate transferase [Chitinophagales bacterium]